MSAERSVASATQRVPQADPVDEEEVIGATEPAPARRGGPVPSIWGAPVLVVEDDELVARSIRRTLERQDYDVDWAPTAEEGLELFATRSHSVVISDINLPGQDGISLLKEMRKQAPETPVVLITGKPSVDTAVAAVDHQAFRYLTKPFRASDLRAAVVDALLGNQMGLVRQAAVDVATPAASDDRADAVRRAIGSSWLAYQPIVDADRRLVGHEGLLRCEESSLRDPPTFLAEAQQTGLASALMARIVELGRIPLVERPEHVLFLNIHSSHLGIATELANDDAFGPYADRVVFELSERSPAGGPEDEALERTLATLRRAGFRLAVDDLGAGYSGVSHFDRIAPSFVKLDRDLVQDVDGAPNKQQVIRALVEVCRGLDIEVVAEGVETDGEFGALKELGCHLFQGFLIGRPSARLV